MTVVLTGASIFLAAVCGLNEVRKCDCTLMLMIMHTCSISQCRALSTTAEGKAFPACSVADCCPAGKTAPTPDIDNDQGLKSPKNRLRGPQQLKRKRKDITCVGQGTRSGSAQ